MRILEIKFERNWNFGELNLGNRDFEELFKDKILINE